MAKGSPYTLLFQKTDTLNGAITNSATSATLTSGNFGTPTGTQLYVLDYDVPASAEVVSAAVAGTAMSSMTRGLDGSTGVAHASGAKVGAFFVPSHYTALKPQIVLSTTFVDPAVTSATYASISMNRTFTTTGGLVLAIFMIDARFQSTSATCFAQMRLKRDSTVLKTGPIWGGVSNATDTNARVPQTLMVSETPAAGAYTYDIELSNPNAQGTINVEDAQLVLLEIAQ